MTRRCSFSKSSCADGGSCGVNGRRAATADDDAEGRLLGLRTGGSLARLPEAPIESKGLFWQLLPCMVPYDMVKTRDSPTETLTSHPGHCMQLSLKASTIDSIIYYLSRLHTHRTHTPHLDEVGATTLYRQTDRRLVRRTPFGTFGRPPYRRDAHGSPHGAARAVRGLEIVLMNPYVRPILLALGDGQRLVVGALVL